MLEALESRRLFSIVIENGTLKINGTPGVDHVLIEEEGDAFPTLVHVMLNSEKQTFKYGDFNKVLIDVAGGKDNIDISELTARATVLGGNGADRIKVNPLSVAVGGEGNDRIFAGKVGHATLLGGLGDDLLQATSDPLLLTLNNPCTMYGGRGNDTIYGGDGADYLSGGAGNDSIFAGGGDDRVLGGAGDDTMGGGDSPTFFGNPQPHNTLIGNSGNDTFIAYASVDEILGGPGRDTSTTRSANDLPLIAAAA